MLAMDSRGGYDDESSKRSWLLMNRIEDNRDQRSRLYRTPPLDSAGLPDGSEEKTAGISFDCFAFQVQQE
jgi:hypothetical protein